MSAVQPRLSLVLPMQARARSVRRPFHPSQGQGSYRLPNSIRDRLTASLAPFRNRDASFALAVFLARFWSTPSRIVDAFPIDRRALADHPELGLTEKRVRSAIRTLEEVGFLDRALASGSKYKATEEGLRKKPILFQLGSDYAPLFLAANRRAAAARGGDFRPQRAISSLRAPSASTGLPEAQPLKRPKNKSEAEFSVLMGPIVKESGLPPLVFDPDSSVDTALARLWQGIRQSRGSGEGRAK